MGELAKLPNIGKSGEQLNQVGITTYEELKGARKPSGLAAYQGHR